jgi:hypothetical protein
MISRNFSGIGEKGGGGGPDGAGGGGSGIVVGGLGKANQAQDFVFTLTKIVGKKRDRDCVS